ncbi:hypothetical protein N752_27615 [Desulforamulus aquiferis]|nr:hypothetical protein N752_27615 [Desulforamulus aquiferis]
MIEKMIKVIQVDPTFFGQYDLLAEGQVLHAKSFGASEDAATVKIRKATSQALKAADTQGLKTLMLPVINSRSENIAPVTTAQVMISEVRRHLSLGSKLQEITFVLPDEAGARAFNEVAHRDTILCLGDSITFGYPEGPQISWVARVSKVTGFKLFNRGISGETTGQMLARFIKYREESLSAYMIFLGGHNDGWQGIPLKETQENIKQVVELAFERGICPLLGLPSPLNIQQLLENFEATRRMPKTIITN